MHNMMDLAVEQDKIRRDHFGSATALDHQTKAIKEILEIQNAVHSLKLIEYADVIICLMNAIQKDGFTWLEVMNAIAYKQSILKRREWNRTDDGTFQHKPGT